MATGSLTSSWSTPASWLDPLIPLVSLTGTGSVEFLWYVGVPPSAATGLPIAAGIYQLSSPSDLHRLYFRCVSGTATLSYQPASAILFDTTKTGYAYSGGSGSDEDFVQSPAVLFGFDDLTTRAAANPYEFAGYLTTAAVGLASGDSVFSAWLTLLLPIVTPERAIRAYGIKYATDQSGSITDWDALQGRTKTTAHAAFTTRAEGSVAVDITAIVQELQAVSGWDADSPIQLYIEDTGSFTNDENALTTINADNKQTSLIITLTSGASPEPPDPGTGGP